MTRDQTGMLYTSRKSMHNVRDKGGPCILTCKKETVGYVINKGEPLHWKGEAVYLPFPETLICEEVISRVRVLGLGRYAPAPVHKNQWMYQEPKVPLARRDFDAPTPFALEPRTFSH